MDLKRKYRVCLSGMKKWIAIDLSVPIQAWIFVIARVSVVSVTLRYTSLDNLENDTRNQNETARLFEISTIFNLETNFLQFEANRRVKNRRVTGQTWLWYTRKWNYTRDRKEYSDLFVRWLAKRAICIFTRGKWAKQIWYLENTVEFHRMLIRGIDIRNKGLQHLDSENIRDTLRLTI